ncbi:MAG TPA: SPOR domain-containing protein [Bacteroidota bacterium]|nr:SPOR domain-containing protein [Bacteroidota bacterium]
MTLKVRPLSVIAAIFAALLVAGCVSTEGTGSTGGSSKEGPERSVAAIDTSNHAVVSVSPQKKQAGKTVAKKPSRSTKFTARQDTVKASLVRKSKPSFRLPKIERPENPAFTVQIGAFLQPNNALRNQKTAKTRFPRQPVFSNFDKRSKFYRLSVGKFMTRQEAASFRKEILRKYPKEYAACWVNYIAR